MTTNARLPALALAVVLVTAGCLTMPVDTPTDDAGESITVTVTEVVDGDTLKFAYENGSTDTARLLGVDTPEVFSPNDPSEYEGVPDTDAGVACLREWGFSASTFARERLDGEEVRFTFDANEPRRGKYGRLLVYVHHDDALFNFQLIDRGLARVYDSDFEKGERFYAAEATAQDERRGLWGCREGRTPTATGDSPLTVVQIHADAEGNDNENLNDEYVVFRNRGDDPLDLSGWRVTDEADREYAFPDGFTLAPGGTVTLYTGSGTDTDGTTDGGVTDGELYWGASGPVWNNDGDTVRVVDDDGSVVFERSYG